MDKLDHPVRAVNTAIEPSLQRSYVQQDLIILHREYHSP